MGSSIDQKYIEGLQQLLKTTCEKLEQQKLESLVVTISPDNHWVTGSEKGQTFMQEKWQFVLDFVHFCEGSSLPLIFKQELAANSGIETKSSKASIKILHTDAETSTPSQHTPIPQENVHGDMFDEDTDDYDDTDDIQLRLDTIFNDPDTKKENAIDESKGIGKVCEAVDVVYKPNKAQWAGKRKPASKSKNSNKPDGNVKLKDGNVKLKDGNVKLKDGNVKLKDGNVKLKRSKRNKDKSDNDTEDDGIDKLTCVVCKDVFMTQELLDAHMESHNTSKCCICKKEFETEAALNEHIQIHIKADEYHKCKECSRAFKLSWQLDEHVEQVHIKDIETEIGQFPCSKCGYVFKFETHLDEHNQLMPNCKDEVSDQVKKKALISGQVSYKDPVSGEMKEKSWRELLEKNESPSACEICLKSFDLAGNYRRHVLLHADLKAYKCFICTKDFKLKENCRKHMKQHDARPYHCSHCHWRFNTKSRRDFHVKFTCTKLKDKPDLACRECGFQCATQSALKDHQLSHTHSGNKMWNCDQCGYSSYCKKNLSVHKLRTHETRKLRYRCDECNMAFYGKGHLTRHVKLHGQLSIFCETCGKGFLNENSKKRHMVVHEDKKKFVCELCSSRFDRPARLKEHMRQHTGERPFICEICAMAFNRNARLIEHRRVHTGEKPYNCTVQGCGKTFGSLSLLKQHKSSHVPITERCYVCDFCGKTFKTTRALSYHRKKHTIEWRWPCIYCDKKYKSLAIYKNHLSNCHADMKDNIERRTNIKLHQCHLCSKTYSKKLDLRRHLFIHEGLKPFQCQFCNKAFNDKSNMKVHEKLHTEDKRYQCNLCYKKFVHPRSLKLHQQNVHCSSKYVSDELEDRSQQSSINHSAGKETPEYMQSPEINSSIPKFVF